MTQTNIDSVALYCSLRFYTYMEKECFGILDSLIQDSLKNETD
jgi:hypothetical protein